MKRCARDNVFKTIKVMLDYKIETRKKVFKAILPSDQLAKVMEFFYNAFWFQITIISVLFGFAKIIVILLLCTAAEAEKDIWLEKKKNLLQWSLVNCLSCGRQ